MITLADGSQKKVEDLKDGDMLLVFNHLTGELDARPLATNSHAEEEAKLQRILNVQFSNGTIWSIVGHHGLFDLTLNQYVIISEENINDFIGHEFYYTQYTAEGFVNETVALTGYYATEAVVKIFSPVSAEFGNYFGEGLLNAPPMISPEVTGHLNYFDFNENMKWDEVKMQADIEEYGLYTYEDYKDYISEDVFNALPFKYFKIGVAKGLMTWADIVALLENFF
jgi:hypothetical protein